MRADRHRRNVSLLCGSAFSWAASGAVVLATTILRVDKADHVDPYKRFSA